MFALQRLRFHDLDKNVMLLFYRSTIETIARYGITIWFDHLTVKVRSQVQNSVKRAGGIVGTLPPSSLQDIFEEIMRRHGEQPNCL